MPPYLFWFPFQKNIRDMSENSSYGQLDVGFSNT
jgi:hypothetical protein